MADEEFDWNFNKGSGTYTVVGSGTNQYIHLGTHQNWDSHIVRVGTIIKQSINRDKYQTGFDSDTVYIYYRTAGTKDEVVLQDWTQYTTGFVPDNQWMQVRFMFIPE